MPERYICDTSSIINLYNNFPNQFRRIIKNCAREDVLRIPEGIWRETRRKTDKIFKQMQKIIEKYPFTLIRVKDDRKIMEKIPNFEIKYGEFIKIGNQRYDGFWKSASGRKAADAQIVAIAKVFNYIVVSDDTAIKLVCMLENIQCIGWTEFARRFGNLAQQMVFDF